MENFKAAMSIPSVLGLDPSNARFVHDLINKQIGPLLPRNMQRALLEGIFSLGRSQLSPLILNTNNPLGSIRLKRLRRILEQDQSLQLQFPAEDLGFRYTSGAIYEQGDASDKVKQHILLGKRNEFKPACKPGVRLPHSFIALLNRHLERVDKGIYSTLDLIKLEKLEFLMFVGPNSSGHLWGESFLLVAKTMCIPAKVVVIWPAGTVMLNSEQKATSSDASMCDNVVSSQEREKIHAWGYDKPESIMHVEEVVDSWWQICKMPCVGAIIVRPDDHIAWISSVVSPPDSIEVLHHVFETILTRTSTMA